MATRKNNSAFRRLPVPPGFQQRINISDNLLGGGLYNPLTPGSVLIDTLPALQEETAKSWSLLAFSVSAQLVLDLSGFVSPPPAYGKFGKIMAGLVIPLPRATGAGGTNSPYDSPMTPLPDTTLLTPLWDPAVDPLPPIDDLSVGTGNTIPNNLPVSCQLVLPEPIEYGEYADPATVGGIGIWMTPSLLGPSFGSLATPAYYLTIVNAQYTIYYDDGK